jgi:hypothetical protein
MLGELQHRRLRSGEYKLYFDIEEGTAFYLEDISVS